LNTTPRHGYDHKINETVDISVRRCFSGTGSNPHEQVVELCVEVENGAWVSTYINLTPEQAATIARDLLVEATTPMPVSCGGFSFA